MRLAATAGGIFATLIAISALQPCQNQEDAEPTSSVPPAPITSPRSPSPLRNSGQAVQVAQAFALDHASLMFGQLDADKVRGASPHLGAELRQLEIPATAERKASGLSLTSLNLQPHGPSSATADAMITAKGGQPWPSSFRLHHNRDRWQVTALYEGP